MIMKRNTALILLLPVALALASCGMTAQYSYQRYNDGIYNYNRVPSQEVTIYSVEDFEAMAAENIAKKRYESKDTVYVLVNDDDSDVYVNFSLAPFLFWDPFFSPWYLPDPWEYRIWYNHYRWYDPWYFGYSWAFDPWYHHYWYDPWYYNPWRDPWYPGGWYDPWPVGPRPPRPGLSPDGRRYYGDRHFTQSPGRRTSVPGTSSNSRNPSSVSRPGYSGYGSSGSSVLRPSQGGGNGSQGGSMSAPSGNGGTGSSPVRSRYSNRQSSPSINIGPGQSSSVPGTVNSGTRTRSTSGSSVRSFSGSSSRGTTGTVRSGSNRRDGTVSSSPSTVMRNSTPARSSSSSFGGYSPGRSSASFPSGGFSGGGGGSRPGGGSVSGGGARRR